MTTLLYEHYVAGTQREICVGNLGDHLPQRVLIARSCVMSLTQGGDKVLHPLPARGTVIMKKR